MQPVDIASSKTVINQAKMQCVDYVLISLNHHNHHPVLLNLGVGAKSVHVVAKPQKIALRTKHTKKALRVLFYFI